MTERDYADGEVGQEEDADKDHSDFAEQGLPGWVIRK